MVNHLKLDDSGGGSNDYLFGTTKTYLRESSQGAHTQVHIFKISLDSSHKINQSQNPILVKLNPSDLGSGSFFTGISDQLENGGAEFHSLMFDPQNMKLFYLKPNFNQASVVAVQIYSDIQNVYESIFIGSAIGTISSENYIKQSYSVGSA